MIPKKLHYAWFGGEKPQYLLDNIKSWEKFLPDYEIIEWNDKNWDINQFLFSQYFFKNGKYGFVIDPLRVDVLKKYGGIYIDADVTLTQNIDKFLPAPLFMGMHYTNAVGTALIGAEKDNAVITELWEFYKNISYEDLSDENLDKVSNGIFTRYFVENYPDFRMTNKIQKLTDGTMFYPKQYFVLPSVIKKHNYATHANVGSWKSNSNIHIKDTDNNKGAFSMIKPIIRWVLSRWTLGATLISWRRNRKQMQRNSLYQLYLDRGKK